MVMLLLQRHASLVVTDSGGLQKEAFLQGTPCVTVRTETEWIELLECGWNCLANPIDSLHILNTMSHQLSFDISMGRPQLYGDGHSCDKILTRLMEL